MSILGIALLYCSLRTAACTSLSCTLSWRACKVLQCDQVVCRVCSHQGQIGLTHLVYTATLYSYIRMALLFC